MFTNNLKTWIGIATGLITIIAAVWVVGSTFATNNRVDKVEVVTERNINIKIEKLGVEVAGALQIQNKAIQTQQLKNNYNFYQFQHDKLVQEKMEIKRQLRRDPNDQGLRQDYIELEEERKRIKQKMDKLMEKIN
jgi:hypothetical protein